MHPQLESIPNPLQALNEDSILQIKSEVKTLLAQSKIDDPHWVEFLSVVSDLSPYLRDCIYKEAAFLGALSKGGFEESFEIIIAKTKNFGLRIINEAEFMAAVRVAKRQVALLCALADLGGWWDGVQVTTALSEFAKTSLSASLDFVLLANERAEKITLKNNQVPQEE